MPAGVLPRGCRRRRHPSGVFTSCRFCFCTSSMDLEKKPLMPKEETAGRGVGAWLCGGDIKRTEEEDDAGTMG